MAAPTARQTFRETVATVAAKAKARLPQAVNGRLEAAVKLVLVQDVTPQDDGSILVGSSTDPLKSYRLVGLTCECQDFTRGQAPEGWCQHRIAAGIAKRVGELLPQEPAPQSTPVETVTAPAPLPEAPASCNVYVTISGHKVQVTLRDSDEQRMLARLQVLLDRYPAPQPAPQASSQGKDWCQRHQVAMKLTTKDGRSWFSHRTAEGQWCKGR
jgi:hypothetical protein